MVSLELLAYFLRRAHFYVKVQEFKKTSDLVVVGVLTKCVDHEGLLI